MHALGQSSSHLRPSLDKLNTSVEWMYTVNIAPHTINVTGKNLVVDPYHMLCVLLFMLGQLTASKVLLSNIHLAGHILELCIQIGNLIAATFHSMT